MASLEGPRTASALPLAYPMLFIADVLASSLAEADQADQATKILQG
jgi:hypothetical protein